MLLNVLGFFPQDRRSAFWHKALRGLIRRLVVVVVNMCQAIKFCVILLSEFAGDKIFIGKGTKAHKVQFRYLVFSGQT